MHRIRSSVVAGVRLARYDRNAIVRLRVHRKANSATASSGSDDKRSFENEFFFRALQEKNSPPSSPFRLSLIHLPRDFSRDAIQLRLFSPLVSKIRERDRLLQLCRLLRNFLCFRHCNNFLESKTIRSRGRLFKKITTYKR